MRFEDYVLSKVSSPSARLTKSGIEKFQTFTTGSNSTNPSASGASDSVSSPVALGFNFVFDGTTYKHFVASVSGWLALVPNGSVTAESVTGSLMLSGSFDNEGINLTNASSNVLICPWFDRLRNTYDLQKVTDSNLSTLDFSGTNANSDFQRKGRTTPVPVVTDSKFGVRYRRESTSAGTRLVVRWNSISSHSFISIASAVLSFECVLYENGKIEFRYEQFKRDSMNNRTEISSNGVIAESATIGIFATGTNRFRDFSQGLSQYNRPQYKYGGATFDTTFNDTSTYYSGANTTVSRKYGWSLRPDRHWPAKTEGCMYVFQPSRARRKVLPRLDSQNRDQKEERSSTFNDQRALTRDVIVQNINYPASVPRFYGGDTIESFLAQNLFSGENFELETTGSMHDVSTEQFMPLNQDLFSHSKPFLDETIASGSFFDTVENFEFDPSMNQPLNSKNRVKMSFQVDKKTRLLDTTSSIYYLNKRTQSWVMPTSTDLTDLTMYLTKSLNPFNTRLLIEDAKGFSAIGTMVSSGTNEASTLSTGGTSPNYNQTIRLGSVTLQTALNDDSYANSVFVNSRYSAITDSTFTPPIDSPFLIEKVVFEIPIECGSTWFNDITRTFMPYSSSAGSGIAPGGDGAAPGFDLGGPAMTVALMNQIRTNNVTKLEVIATGTITHQFDNVSRVVLGSDPPAFTGSFHYNLRPEGFLRYGTPAAVIRPGNNNVFTGTINVNTKALASYGPTFRFFDRPDSTTDVDLARAFLLNQIGSQTILSTDIGSTFRLMNVKTSGRAGNREISGRSIMGREFGVTQLPSLGGAIYPDNIPNPFYVTGSEYAALSASIQNVVDANVRIIGTVPVVTYFDSPYLINPRDTLVLSLSKTRPTVFSYDAITKAVTVSGSVQHDVSLITGSVNVTLYGSYLREGKDTVNKRTTTLFSRGLNDVIGDIPVADQFEVVSAGELVNGSYDDYITGSLAVRSATGVLTGIRGKVFSKFNARTQSKPDVSPAELLANPSRAFRLQPWNEVVGSSTTLQMFDNNERFFDSTFPGVSDILAKDGKTMGTSGFISILALLSGTINTASAATVLFSPGSSITNDLRWPLGYPFEPHYAGIVRNLDISKTFFTTIDADQSGSVTSIDPLAITNFYYSFVSSPFRFNLFIDVNLSSNVTSSMRNDDLSKVFYGFGDFNNSTPTSTYALTKQPQVREIRATSIGGFLPYRFLTGPMIRGWKYGLISGLATFNKAHYRRGCYGQFRDMLEQRLDTKFYAVTNRSLNSIIKQEGIMHSPLTVRFVNSLGKTVSPLITNSQNLSFEATSSMPYFADETRNRVDVSDSVLNTNLVSFSTDSGDNTIV